MKKLGILGTSWYYSFNEQLSRKLLFFFSRIEILPENSIHARSHDPIVYKLKETDKRKRERLFLYYQVVLVIGISSFHTRQYWKNEIPRCNLINKHCKSRFNATLVLNRFINWVTQSFITTVSGLSQKQRQERNRQKIEERENEQIQYKAESTA